MTAIPQREPVLLASQRSAASARARVLVFADAAAQALLRFVERIAPSAAPLLITGETGTGKELLARHVHQLSGRRGAFVAVNCGAISETLADSELFGHEAGAFTGAIARREGWFEAAHGGTLFLDELGDLPLGLQVKLLRVLQEREVVRVGSRKPIAVDVRLLAATNVDLSEAVRAGRFRLDLYYRLNVAPVRLPPLRERSADIAALAQHFLSDYAQRLGLPLPALAADALAVLERYRWPGNIRELENVIHHALLVISDAQITAHNLGLAGLPAATTQAGAAAPAVALQDLLGQWLDMPGTDRLHQVEKLLVDEAFRRTGRNQVQTAALLGISRNSVRTLLRKHGHLDEVAMLSDRLGLASQLRAATG